MTSCCVKTAQQCANLSRTLIRVLFPRPLRDLRNGMYVLEAAFTRTALQRVDFQLFRCFMPAALSIIHIEPSELTLPKRPIMTQSSVTV